LISCRLLLQSFPVDSHPGQGYILYSLRKKLKAELVGRSQEEIKELRLAGQEVTDTYQVRPAGSGTSST
jgi:ribonuclease Z